MSYKFSEIKNREKTVVTASTEGIAKKVNEIIVKNAGRDLLDQWPQYKEKTFFRLNIPFNTYSSTTNLSSDDIVINGEDFIRDNTEKKYSVEDLKTQIIAVKIQNEQEHKKLVEISKLNGCGYYNESVYYLYHGYMTHSPKNHLTGGAILINFNQIDFQENMKEVISYKVIKSFPSIEGRMYNVGDVIGKDDSFFKIGNTIPEFLEAVYAPEFKVGDYVIAADNNISSKEYKGQIALISFISNDGIYRYKLIYNKGANIWSNIERAATDAEIEEYNAISIGGYKAEVVGKAIKFGCVILTEDMLSSYKYLLKSEAKATIHVKDGKIFF